MRPKHTRPDANQAQIITMLRERGYKVLDVHNLPGDSDSNPLDIMVLSPGGVWLQVEIKNGPTAPFTDNEREYLKSLSLWPPVQTRWPVIVAYSVNDILTWYRRYGHAKNYR